MNLRTLRYFVTIADSGSFTKAAASIPIAQPALTRQIRDLETELGINLFERLPRGVVLTAAGATFYGSARRILAEATRVRERLTLGQGNTKTTATLGTPPTLASLFLPGLIERCGLTLKGVAVRTRESFTPALLDWLERGVIDMAIVTNAEAGRPVSLRPLLSEPFVLVGNRTIVPEVLVGIDQLARIPLLMTSLHRAIVERQLTMLGRHLDVQWEIDSVDAIRELVMQGDWATIMPISVFKRPGYEELRMAEISGVQLNRQLALATRLDRRPSPASSLLEDLIDGEFERLAVEGRFSFASSR